MVSATVKLERARRLRRDATDAERKLWTILRNRSLGEAKFRRQVPVGPYIADFLCHDPAIIVEADGGQHGAFATDARRDRCLQDLGFRVLRFWNNDIVENIDGVASAILTAVRTPHPPTAARWAPPSPHRGEGNIGATLD